MTARSFLARAMGLASLVVLGTSPLTAQEPADSLTGRVFDEVTGSPVAGVSVVLTDSAGTTLLRSAVSDLQGRFALAMEPGRYLLLASRPGYAASPPRPVSWEGTGGRLDGVLLNVRSLDPEELAVRAEADATRENGQVLGRILDRGTGAPVLGAEVALLGSGLRTLTDPAGIFVFPDVPPGLEILRLSHLAYGERTRELVVEAGSSYRVEGRLEPEAVELEGLEVTVASRNWFRQMDDLRIRMQAGLGGSFILADELERRGYPPLAETLREVPGVRVQRNRFDWRITMNRCATPANSGEPVIYLDGMRVHRPGSGEPMTILQSVSSADVEAVEVYKGAASVPAEFAGSDAACGVIVIWTRRGGG